MTTSPESHAQNWDLRHPDFNDNDLLYDVYTVMRQGCPFPHTDTPPFLADTPPGGAWIAVNYDDCYRIAQDWEHFSNNPVPGSADFVIGDLVVMMDPPRQQKLRKVLNPYFSPAQMKALRPQVTTETDLLIDDFIGAGAGGDLARVAWRQPGSCCSNTCWAFPPTMSGSVFNSPTTPQRGGDRGHPDDGLGGWAVSVHPRHRHGPHRPTVARRHDRHPAGRRDRRGRGCPSRMPLPTRCCSSRPVWRPPPAPCLSPSTTWPPIRVNVTVSPRTPDLLPPRGRGTHPLRGSIHGLHRTVTKDVELSGHTFHAGDTVVVNFAAANRDDNVFPRCEPLRARSPGEPSSGLRCGCAPLSGLQLGALEFQIGGVERVLSRLPDFRLATGARPDFHGNSITRGFRTVPPVEFSLGYVGIHKFLLAGLIDSSDHGTGRRRLSVRAFDPPGGDWVLTQLTGCQRLASSQHRRANAICSKCHAVPNRWWSMQWPTPR